MFEPADHNWLARILDKAKRKHAPYDALVPLSGGKDSSYILYLARKEYDLKVLTYTFDNGFLTPAARRNIQALTESLTTDHVFFQPSWNLLKRLYKSTLLQAGDMCGVCGIGMVGVRHRLVAAFRIPVVLLGFSPMEKGTASPERIYDTDRFKAIVRDAGQVTQQEIDVFIGSRPRRPLVHALLKKLGRIPMPLKISPLFYREYRSEEEIRDILLRETGWRDVSDGATAKHFDCVAERFTNYIREHRHGYSRRACQYSNLIRMGEMSREDAQRRLALESPRQEPSNMDTILELLDLTRKDVDRILRIETHVYE